MTTKKTSTKAAKAASKTLRGGKTAAGSALSQRAMSKKGHISSREAGKAVKTYLSDKRV